MVATATGFEDLDAGQPAATAAATAIPANPAPTGFEDLEGQRQALAEQQAKLSAPFTRGLIRGPGLSVRNVVEALSSPLTIAENAGVSMGNYVNRGLGALGIKTYPYRELSNTLGSDQLGSALDAVGLPKPENGGERATAMIEQALAGSRVPSGEGTLPFSGQTPVSPQFMTPAQTKAQMLAERLKTYQAQGFSVPPSTTNPTYANRSIEALAGKIATQQGTAATNADAFQAAAARSLGQNPDAPLTLDAVKQIRSDAGDAYEALRGIPDRIQTGLADPRSPYNRALNSLYGKYKGAAVDFPGLGRPDVQDILDKVRVGSFSGDSAVDALKVIRENADKAYAGGDTGLGAVWKGMGKAIEDQIERHLTTTPSTQRWQMPDLPAAGTSQVNPDLPWLNAPAGTELATTGGANSGAVVAGSRGPGPLVPGSRGPGSTSSGSQPFAGNTYDLTPQNVPGPANQSNAQILENYRNARRLIARSYTVEEAMRAGNGQVSGSKLGSMLQRGDYMDGDLLDAARFGNDYPKASLVPNHSAGVSHLDSVLTVAGALAGEREAGLPGLAAGAAWPLAREGARRYLFSPAGQARALPNYLAPGPVSSPQALAAALQAYTANKGSN